MSDEKKEKAQKRKNRMHVINVNLMSLGALPMLFFSTAFKMLALGMAQLQAVLKIILGTASIAFVFAVGDHASASMNRDVLVGVCLVFGGSLAAVFGQLLDHEKERVEKIAVFLDKKFEKMYDKSYSSYLKIYHNCRKEAETLPDLGKDYLNDLQSSMFLLLRSANKWTISLLNDAVYVVAVVGILIVIWSIIGLQRSIREVFGLNILDYLRLFSWSDLIYGLVTYFTVKIGVILLLVVMGGEWKKWSATLDTGGHDDSIQSIKDSKVAVKEGFIIAPKPEDSDKKDQAAGALDKLNAHLDSFEEFQAKVASVANNSSNYMLRTKYNEYITQIKDVTGKASGFDVEIPAHEFAPLADEIDQVDALKDEIEALLTLTESTKEVKLENPGFFHGCDDEEALEERMNGLRDCYGSDGGTLAYIESEYKKKKEELS